MSDTKGNKTIDIDEDVIRDVANTYNEMYTLFKENKVQTEGYVTTAFSQYKITLKKKSSNVSKLFDEVGKEIINTLNRIGTIDDSIKDDFDTEEYSFTDVINLLGSIKGGSKITKANRSFFEGCPNATITDYKDDNGNMQYKVECNGYTYDSRTSTLTTADGKSLVVKYYVPTNCGNVSELNTITCLSGQGESDMYSQDGSNSFFFDDISCNSILVVPSKKNKSGVDVAHASFSYMGDEVAESTRFIVSCTNQDEGAINSIIGCSSGGGSALKIAANSGDLYDNVVSVNYALVMKGQGQGVNEGDDNRLTQEELDCLDGKNIMFVSVKGDANLNNGRDSYAYIGLQNALSNCQNASITFATNDTSSLYSNIESDNYQYLGQNSQLWQNCLSTNYEGHGAYHKVFRDLVNSGILDYNMNS